MTFLAHVNYYRFTGYALEFREWEDGRRLEDFHLGTSFEQVRCRYEFDKKLRNLLMEAVAPVEIAFRSHIALELALDCGHGFWYRDAEMFRVPKDSDFRHERFLNQVHEETKKSKEIFLQHFRETYEPCEEPPAWMLTEILTMGTWSHLYKALASRAHRKRIASSFRTDPETLASWMHALTYLRNLCAHHARLWNRVFAIRPKLSEELRLSGAQPDRLSAFLALLHLLHGNLKLNQTLPRQFSKLLQKHPQLPLEPMGFRQGWQDNAFWTTKVSSVIPKPGDELNL